MGINHGTGDIGTRPCKKRKDGAPHFDATSDQRIWLSFVIGNRVRDPRAILYLRALVDSKDAVVRAAAVQAFWRIADQSEIPLLISELQDPARVVRFYAVRVLADIANEPGWGGPGESEFQEHEQRYLDHWRDWKRAQVHQ